MTTAAIAVAGIQARNIDGAVVDDVGAPHPGGPLCAAIVGADGDGVGVATGGSGIAGVSSYGRSDGVRNTVGAARPVAGESMPASCCLKTARSSSISFMC